jgi:membrane protease YdiL (CAAX protease family)
MSNALSPAAWIGPLGPRLASWAVAAGAAGASAPASQPQTAPVEVALHPVQLALLAVGLCTLAVWIVRRWARPAKLKLTRAPGRPNRLHPLHVLAALAAWQGAAAILVGLLARGFEGFAAFTFRHGLRRGLGLSARRWLYDSARGVLAYLSVLPVCMGLFLLMASILPERLQKPHVLLEYFGRLPSGWRVAVVVSAVVLAPVSEEIFFRGLFQSMLRRYTKSPWAAILLTSLFFAAIHVPYWHTLPSLFALAIALGYNYERTGRLFAPIVIHVLFNAVNLYLAGGV